MDVVPGIINNFGSFSKFYSFFSIVSIFTIQPDKRRGFDLALKACDLGVAQSCANVSVMYRTGDGVDQNETLAKRFANIAKDIVRQSADDRRRTEFQQGAETAF